MKGNRTMTRGIIDRTAYGIISKLSPGTRVLLMRSLHEAQRAGKHYDIRLGSPETNLFSWATRKEFPQEPGQTIALYQQPVHSWKYQYFSGQIPRGYGAGYVHPAEKFDAILHDVSDDSLTFSLQTPQGIQRFQLIKKRQSGSKPVWYLTNITPTLEEYPEKLHYTPITEDQARKLINEINKSISSVQPKLDGALSLIRIKDNKIEVFSHRISKKTGQPILHTERIFPEIPKVEIPKSLDDTLLLGEIYAVQKTKDGERVLPPNELSALLNSGLAKSREKQRQLGIEFRVYVFDTVKHGKPDEEWSEWYLRPYEQRRNFINQVIKYLPKYFHAPIEAKTPEDAERLLLDIKRRVHPLTREGVVLFPNAGVPFKFKTTKERDVYIRELTPGEGKYKGKAVGGFRFSYEPEGQIVGTVGSGLDDMLRQEMWKRPEEFIGRKARVKYQEELPSKSLRAPVFLGLHEG